MKTYFECSGDDTINKTLIKCN